MFFAYCCKSKHSIAYTEDDEGCRQVVEDDESDDCEYGDKNFPQSGPLVQSGLFLRQQSCQIDDDDDFGLSDDLLEKMSKEFVVSFKYIA